MVESSGALDTLTPLSAAEFHRRLLHFLYSKKNSKFAIACFFIATGSAEADGVSMTEFAKSFGVTKAMVSKYCREICAYFSIQPSRYMRSEENANASRLANRRPQKNGTI